MNESNNDKSHNTLRFLKQAEKLKNCKRKY